MKLPSYDVVAVAALCSMSACVRDASREPTTPLSNQASFSAVPIQPYGIGADHARGASCAAPEFRQFDFWLGSWDVRVGAGALAGTNIVERELDGCVIEENWTDGGRGRSINMYDPNDGLWHQHWVYSGGGAQSVLILAGRSPHVGALSMAGRRRNLAGASVRDSIAWTAITRDSVRQHWSISLNGAPYFTFFDGRYRRVAGVTPIPVVFIPTCTNRAANHEFDFLLGTWRVSRGGGLGNGVEHSPTIVTVTSDLDYCLIEETIIGSGNYRGWSFSGYQPGDRVWYRTYVDNQGQRLQLSGGRVGGDMVLVGTMRRPGGGEAKVRLTYETTSPDRVTQHWEYSIDDGATWTVGLDVVLAKRP